jgi:hypothetical protein
MNFLAAAIVFLAATLPPLGTKLPTLPPGKGRVEVESACYRCHSAELLLQQRLTEKQWTATVEKMMRWGAVVSEKEKPVVIDYLTRNFGPGNRWKPQRAATPGRAGTAPR